MIHLIDVDETNWRIPLRVSPHRSRMSPTVL